MFAIAKNQFEEAETYVKLSFFALKFDGRKQRKKNEAVDVILLLNY